jgi:hypothetical protein
MLTQELLAEAAVIATQALSARPAFHSRSAAVAPVVRRQHLIVPQTNPAMAGVRGYSQTRTKKCTNPSLLIRNKPLTFHAAVPPSPNTENKQTNKPLTFISTYCPLPK